MGQIQSIEEFLDLLRRRRILIIAVALLGMLAVGVYLKSRPDSFEATAVIQIEVPMVSDAEGAPVSSGAAQLLQTIQQRLTTRDNLLAMIDRHGLFADAVALTADQKVSLLRAAVRFDSVASATGQAYGAPPQIAAILVVARLGAADLAARVANDFAQSILDQSSEGQLSRARETADFFSGEEARVWAEISALEAEIATYQNTHAQVLPARRAAYAEEWQALDDDLREFEQEKVALDNQRAIILARGSLRATDQRELGNLDAQISVLAAQRAAVTARLGEIDAVLAQTPDVERALSGYDRQLQQLQEQYEVINRRLAEAKTSQLLAERQQAERFTLLERAVTPQYAVGGGRTKLMVVGAIASVVGAIVLAFMLDLANPVVRTADQMERQLDLRPVVSIPEVGAAARSRQRAVTLMKLVDDPKRPILGLPRYAVFAGGATLCLMLAAAAIA